MIKFSIDNFEDSAKKLQDIVDNNHKEIDKLLAISDKNYDNFVVPYQLIGEVLNNFLTPIYHIDSVCNSELTQNVYDECLPIISQYYRYLSQNEHIYTSFKDIDNRYKTR